MTRRSKSTKARRSANMEKAPADIGYEPCLDKVVLSEEPIPAETLARGMELFITRALDPLQSPQHRRALREAAKAGMRDVVEKWLMMGADPEDVAFALEGQRVEVMAIGRARGKQG